MKIRTFYYHFTETHLFKPDFVSGYVGPGLAENSLTSSTGTDIIQFPPCETRVADFTGLLPEKYRRRHGRRNKSNRLDYSADTDRSDVRTVAEAVNPTVISMLFGTSALTYMQAVYIGAIAAVLSTF